MKISKSINNALNDLLTNNKEVVLFGEDISDPYGGAFKITKGLSTKFPNRVLSTPISEAAIVGMAGGMSISGLKPIVEIMFGDFMALTIDQILNHLTKYSWMYNNRVSTPVTIRTAMGGRRGYGPTHSQSLEPLLSSIPLIKIISPSQYHSPEILLKECVLNDDNVTIFSEHKLLYPENIRTQDNHPDGLSFEVSSEQYPVVRLTNCEFDDPELLIITHGGNALLAEQILLELLLEYELKVECIIPSLIKPISIENIIADFEGKIKILFLEESQLDNGWSCELIAKLAENELLRDREVIRIGAMDIPIPSAIHLEKEMLPNKQNIINKVTQLFNL